MKLYFAIFLCFCSIRCVLGQGKSPASLTNDRISVQFKSDKKNWAVNKILVKNNGEWVNGLTPSGEYTLLYSETKPSPEPAETFEKITGGKFPEDNYHYQQQQWKESTTEVALNKAGQVYHFFPANLLIKKDELAFTQETEVATVKATWKLDPQFPNDVQVTMRLIPKKKGYFSLATPTLASVATNQMAWTSVPGYFQGNFIQKNFALAYTYGHGIPDRPVVYRERCATTLSPLISTKSGITLSVIPEPGLARDPWAKDKITQTDWHLGLSHMNRKAQLSPTLYYPVLGEQKSELNAGEEISYSFRYSLIAGDWFQAIKHAANDIYKFHETLSLRQSKQALTGRIEKMHHYLTDPKTSLWNIEEYEGKQIGAQSYLGGVVGSNKDAMKNADYGAMWMLANATNDPELKQKVLPPALNFKLVQQETKKGFFEGAIEGQYYLAKSKKFVEEWGEVVEPIALTYYVLLDMGNMLLFEPENAELKERLRLGADKLLNWQNADGSWAVAYDRKTEQELFKDIKDVRPTFYGMIVAYRLLKDEKYLKAAQKGADWFIKNAVETGTFLGVCGDARYAPDFATGQSAQALLDLYDFTKNKKYQDAAVTCAKIYTASVYTHPIASRNVKNVNGNSKEDWEISQTGLSFEHGGIFGSATRLGPIQLASHAGLFIRMYQLTGEKIFADMARSAAIGRDAFVDSKTSVASYYWQAMNKGAGPYPHHAWWQIGWITDYLLSEAALRSKGKIEFPRGFVTPKVGPHQTYGFAPGTVYGDKAKLVIMEGFAVADKPAIDVITAKSTSTNSIYVVLMNNSPTPTEFGLKLDASKISNAEQIAKIEALGNEQITKTDQITIEPFGLKSLKIELR
ncbi:glycerophosphoryl diester phosphodiesterase [Dyadobacter sp. LJ53]|uniref:glycerophosphoryl diester phosphodiesterase n=1 Tax=Dyadobacter chenwenxiniae TaxID=2906456 RepID=UPI001F3DE0BB|nr:glycerophosphoryl diester phosphodiesterase [Dyadobacter chenwenxiniae]MCF0052207.1 glycerophosphoryl diester phosphodiesterase [Dyadobacter chenwenxiniae]